MSDACEAKSGVVFTTSTNRVSSIVSPGAEELLRRYAEGNWDSVNSRAARVLAKNHAGFLTDHDIFIFTDEELRVDPFYRDFLYPEGIGWCVGTHNVTPNDDTLIMSFDREFTSGPVPKETVAWLDTLRPHLARSLSMTARLKEKVAVAITDTLGAFGLPACLVDARGRMKAANALMMPLVPSYIVDHRDRVMLRHAPSDILLAEALRRRAACGGVMSVPVPPIDDLPAAVIHIVPVAGRGRDLFPNGLCILAVTFAGSSGFPDAPILRGLFDLTPAEA
jgi:hypothetical protein